MSPSVLHKEWLEILAQACEQGRRVMGKMKNGSKFSGIPQVWKSRKYRDNPEEGGSTQEWFIGYNYVHINEMEELELE